MSVAQFNDFRRTMREGRPFSHGRTGRGFSLRLGERLEGEANLIMLFCARADREYATIFKNHRSTHIQYLNE